MSGEEPAPSTPALRAHGAQLRACLQYGRCLADATPRRRERAEALPHHARRTEPDGADARSLRDRDAADPARALRGDLCGHWHALGGSLEASGDPAPSPRVVPRTLPPLATQPLARDYPERR